MMQNRYILTLAALACVMCAVAGCAKQAADLDYQPTGNQLYDRFAVLVLGQLDDEWPQGEFDYSEVLTWESEFADDAQYWQLRAFVDLEGRPDDLFNVFMEGKTPYVDTLLMEKIAAGFTTSGCYAGLLWPSDGKDNMSGTLDLLDQAVAGNPDTSYFHYIEAALMVDAGSQSGVIDALEAGNTSKANGRIYSFPYSMVLNNPQQVEAAGNQAVAGYLANSHFQRALVEQVHLKKMFMAQLTRPDLTREDLSQLTVTAQRLGTRPNSTMIELVTCLGYHTDVQQVYSDADYGLSTEQLDELADQVALREAIQLEISEFSLQKQGDKTPEEIEARLAALSGQESALQTWLRIADDREFIAGIQSKIASLHPQKPMVQSSTE